MLEMHFQRLIQTGVVPSQSLHRAPETVSQVEPQGNQPNDIQHEEHRIREVCMMINTVGCMKTTHHQVAHVVHFRELHFVPEV